MAKPLPLAEVNALSWEDFVSTFGDVFEHSSWIAERAWEARPFGTVDELHSAMTRALEAAGENVKLELMRAHPELAGKAALAGNLTEFSGREQAGAGLNACTRTELSRIADMNARYREKFGFPFIVAVKGLDKAVILEKFESRLASTRDGEFAENLRQIERIAKFRLAELIAND